MTADSSSSAGGGPTNARKPARWRTKWVAELVTAGGGDTLGTSSAQRQSQLQKQLHQAAASRRNRARLCLRARRHAAQQRLPPTPVVAPHARRATTAADDTAAVSAQPDTELLAAVATSRVRHSHRSVRSPPPRRAEGMGDATASAFDHETMAQLLFQEIDTDGSGTLEPEELAALSRQLGHPLSAQELDAAMAEMDADGNGHVDFDEFLPW
jgi:hypothetical protein|eukprot:COSAG01_NODE_4326_length_5131_cov_18.323132_2_plen_212_part_00